LVTSTWPLAHPALYLHQPLQAAAPQCISGRTSYLHVRLEFLLYPQVIPQFCNTGGFEPRRTFTSASLCPWIAHVVSGRIAATSLALFRLGFPLAPLLYRRLTRNVDALAGSFYKRHAISPWWLLPQWPLTACEYVVSGSLSSPSRGAFHLSLTVLVHYRSLKVLSLGGWSPLLPTRFHVPRGTQDPSPALALARYGPLTLCGGAFQHLRVRAPAFTLVLQPRPLFQDAGLGSSRFARHYYGNLG
jgi:hypothetical protein